MNQLLVLKILNPIIFISLIMQIFTGVTGILFEELHSINGYLLAVLVIAHLFLNRAWIITAYFKKRK